MALKKPNITGGICNGITAKNGAETDIEWAPYNQASGDAWRNWRWIEQWLPHDAWFLQALAHVNNIINNPLPVTLLDFTIQLNNKKITGSFITTQEQNISSHILEKSTDGKTFSYLTSFTPKNSETNIYTFEDSEIQYGRSYYYRIASVDIDGMQYYSSIKQITLKNEFNVYCYPVPFTNELYIQLLADSIDHAFISVYDANGAIVYNTQSENNSIKINTSCWQNGMYLIKIISSLHVSTVKVMK